MNKLIAAACILSLTASTGIAQTKKAAKSSDTKKVTNAADAGFTTSSTGLEYKIVSHEGTSTRKPAIGDYISLHMVSLLEDSVLFSTRQVLDNKPAEIQLQQAVRGDVAEGFSYMSEGDSAIFRMSIDTLMTLPNFQAQPWMKKGVGQKLQFHARLVSVKSPAEKQAEAAAQAAAQVGIDDAKLQAYFKEKNLKPTKTSSGMYYTVDKQGTGATAKEGDTVVVYYTGKTMDGKTFDSNIDPEFKHPQPFEFPVGKSMVIKGWDEAFAMFKTGTKGTIYIPSPLAYGANSPDPSRIPANSILIFDIELKDVKAQGGGVSAQPATTAPAPASQKKK